MQMPPPMAFPKGGSFMPQQQQRMEVTVPVPEARVSTSVGPPWPLLLGVKPVFKCGKSVDESSVIYIRTHMLHSSWSLVRGTAACADGCA